MHGRPSLASQYMGADTSLQVAEEALRKNGPVDGILGRKCQFHLQPHLQRYQDYFRADVSYCAARLFARCSFVESAASTHSALQHHPASKVCGLGESVT